MTQRTFTIEVVVDYIDEGKNAAMRVACQQAGQLVFATANLLKDHLKPKVAVHSNDWFSPQEEIELIPNTIQAGLDLIGDDSEPVHPELLAAFSQQ